MARQTFVRHVRPILEAAGFHLDIRETKGPGHATDIVKEAELQIFDAVVAVGGDGTIFEILQVQPSCCLDAAGDEFSSALLAHSITAYI
jgi:diacylglycerol kinase family enzyme